MKHEMKDGLLATILPRIEEENEAILYRPGHAAVQIGADLLHYSRRILKSTWKNLTLVPKRTARQNVPQNSLEIDNVILHVITKLVTLITVTAGVPQAVQ